MRYDKDEVERRQKERISAVPDHVRKFYQKAYSKKSRAVSMKIFCLECMGFDKDEVRECTAPACPLWLWRPYQNKE